MELILKRGANWIDEDTTNFYSNLRYPAENTTARGLLYSTTNATYAKITVKKCNLNQPNNTCKSD